MGWKPLLSTEVAGGVQAAAAPPPADQYEQPEQASSWLGRRADDLTGANRTQFPAMQEFGQSFKPQPLAEDAIPTMQRLAVGGGDESGTPEQVTAARQFLDQQDTVTRASVSPNENAQLDILRKAIPGLEEQRDKYGNVMLRAPGMTDFAYLNKPGVSKQDLREFGVQSALTAPLLGPAGRAVSLTGRVVAGGLGLGAGSVAQDMAATNAGSEQGIDADRALTSGAIGAGLPLAGAIVRGVAGNVAGRMTNAKNLVQNVANPKGAAQREVQNAFQRDFDSGALNNLDRVAQPSDRAIAAGRNQDLRVMDFGGENVASEARKAANFSPSARDAMMRVIGDRFEGQSARASNVIENEFNLARSSDQARQDLMTQARNARAPLYNQAFQQGAGGISTPVLDSLERSPTFQKAMGRAERSLSDQNAMPGWRQWDMKAPNGDYTLAYWDQVKQNLDDYAGQAIRQGRRNQAATITEMARRLRGELDANASLYSQARGTAQQFFKADNALEAGENFAKGSFNLHDAEQMVNKLNPAEKNLFSEGFADHFVQKIRAAKDRTSILNSIMASPMEQDRVRIALGQGRFDQLEAFMRIEGIMDKMRHAMGNSTTARQSADMLKGYGVDLPVGLLSHALHPAGAALHAGAMIYGAIKAGGQAMQLRINEKVAEEIGNLLASKDPDLFLRGLQMAGKAPINQAIRQFDNMLTMSQPFTIQQGVNQMTSQPGQ